MLLLDTHAWVWWATRPDRLSRKQRSAIERTLTAAREPLLLSVISCWEVALLSEHRRIRLTLPLETWLEEATAVPGLEVVPLSLPIIASGSRLTTLRDPADMLIVATAHHRGARLVTSDVRIGRTDLVPVVS
jgi:PIN domain nuclease of toxin-antitoxin system